MKRRSLAGRFVTVMVAGALSLAVVAGALSYHLARQRTEAEVSATLNGMMTAIENTVAIGIYLDDGKLLDELVAGVIRHPQINAARVLGVDARTLATATDVAKDAEPARPAVAEDGLRAERQIYSPFDSKELLGRLVVEADDQYLRTTVRRQAAQLGLVLVGLIVVLALLLNTLTLRMIVNPMALLARQLASMKPGTSERVMVGDAHADDEIGTVVEAANRLLETNHAALARERSMREAVAAMEARYRQIFDHTSAGIFLLDSQYRLVNSNRAISELLGASPPELEQLRDSDFIATLFLDPAAVRNMVTTAKQSGQTSSADLEVRTLDGSQRWVHCLISLQADQQDGSQTVEGVVYDVTQRRMVESEFAYMVEHDALTGLKSRAFFHKVLRHYVEKARTIHTSVTLVFVDLDQFKNVNDTHGHEAGDYVLIECARRLQNLLHRSSDLAARLGGDEFTVILDGLGADDPAAQDLARRIVRAMQEPIDVSAGTRVRIGASVGLASFPLNAADSDELVRAADRAMYEVKQMGKGNWRVSASTTALAG